MTSSIKKLMVFSILVATLLSCNQESTLQSYYVDNELKSGFTSVDVPISMLKIDTESLTEEQKEAYESVEKLSMIAFVLDDNNQAAYNEEFAKVKAILKNPKYQELIRGGNVTDGKFVVNFIGEEESVEEFVLLGSANEKGFAVIRVLGDDMNLNKIMKLASVFETMDLEDGQLKEFTEFFD
ncbi:DUF4252 domain-containing protein [Sediminibacter sp. Hel_I_10]|uniref:DUF4252 domain-containing protein n=1 Tax=Sediminibacter sp. Hel_I_10 TaxID=1392490 RepID=UPI00056B0F16|nr:DUF4252 domain-containing protein [Sediminibacter sp. Hel_I_10]